MRKVLRRNFPIRIALIAAALQAAVLVLVLGGVYVSTALTVRRAVDSALVTAALGSAGEDGVEPGGDGARVLPPYRVDFHTVRVPPRHEEDEDEEEWELRRLFRWLPEAWHELLWPSRRTVRVATIFLPGGSVRVATTAAGALAGEMRHVLRHLGAVAAAAIPVTSLIVFWVAHQAYAPLREVAATVAAIGPSRLDTRIRPRIAGEDQTVARLVEVLNGMLDRLQAGFRAQARFVDDAAHELRTPLGALRTRLEVALRHPRDAEGYRRALADALADVERLGRLVDDLLLLARHERGAALPLVPDVPLAPLVARADRELASQAEAAAVTVVTDVPQDLAADCDPVALERVLTNLLRNAIAHSPPGGVVTVEARAEVRDGVEGVAIQVSDQGPGIPPEDLPHVFDRFYRGRGGRRGDGAGLGLAIARAVVEAHHGRITVDSAPGAGARFTVWIPRKARFAGGGEPGGVEP
ncbi:MAG: HAMP domain-containing histidine kinase [Firmicutes bacterium]|nr:HAMP domain-containing histidine kinase [Bacillota bacterium]